MSIGETLAKDDKNQTKSFKDPTFTISHDQGDYLEGTRRGLVIDLLAPTFDEIDTHK